MTQEEKDLQVGELMRERAQVLEDLAHHRRAHVRHLSAIQDVAMHIKEMREDGGTVLLRIAEHLGDYPAKADVLEVISKMQSLYAEQKRIERELRGMGVVL